MRLRLALPETDFSREFVVDERPEMLYESERIHSSESVGEADLVSLAARVMIENERLERLATQLEESAQTDAVSIRLVRSLMPVLDSFERVCALARGFETSEVLANWLRSVEGVEARLLEALRRQGLERVDPLGQQVDLDRDEVVECRPSRDHPDDTVVEVRRKGFRFRGKLLRDAQVIVSQS